MQRKWMIRLEDITGVAGDISRSAPQINGDSIIIATRDSVNVISLDRHTGAVEWVQKVRIAIFSPTARCAVLSRVRGATFSRL